MFKRIRLGIIAGMIVMIINIFTGMIIGIYANCFTIFTVMIATGIVELQCVKRGYSERAILSGGINGGMIGLFSLIGQILGLIGGYAVTSMFLNIMGERISFETHYPLAAAASWVFVYILLAVILGVVNVLAGTVVGAFAAKPVSSNR
jgi:hypothetical protein